MLIYAIFICAGHLCSLFLRGESQTRSIDLYKGSFAMDIVYVGAIAALWGLMALLVAGFRKLERPQGGRP